VRWTWCCGCKPIVCDAISHGHQHPCDAGCAPIRSQGCRFDDVCSRCLLDCGSALVVGGIRRTPDGKIDYKGDFFGRPSFLTVSGQLQGEYYACGLSSIYTFGPTFRAEQSHTTRHLAEFWMIEPEIAFCDLEVRALRGEPVVGLETRRLGKAVGCHCWKAT